MLLVITDRTIASQSGVRNSVVGRQMARRSTGEQKFGKKLARNSEVVRSKQAAAQRQKTGILQNLTMLVVGFEGKHSEQAD
jgi:hypothetical protein